MTNTTARIRRVALDELQAAPGNVKAHNVTLVADSIRRFGFADPVVVDQRTGEILAGHGRVEALRLMRDAGEPIPGGIAGGWQVPVYVGWASKDDLEADAARVALNRSTEAGGWDEPSLLGLLERLGEVDDGLVGVGFDDSEIAELRDKLASFTDPDLSDDATPEPPADPISKVGDIWQVGPHRISCGDSTDPDVLDRLLDGDDVGCLLTDPPYGINLDTDYTKTHKDGGNYRSVVGDDQPFDASFHASYFDDVTEQFWFGADYYRRTIPTPDLDGSWLVWDKRDHETMDLSKVHGSHFELIWSRQKHQRRMLRHLWSGHYGMQTDDTRSRVHPTQKPVALLAEILDRWAPDGCVVADPFAGSGSTLIAAHRTGRIGYGIELDPTYVDVIVSRLEAETGLAAKHAVTGELFADRDPQPTEE